MLRGGGKKMSTLPSSLTKCLVACLGGGVDRNGIPPAASIWHYIFVCLENEELQAIDTWFKTLIIIIVVPHKIWPDRFCRFAKFIGCRQFLISNTNPVKYIFNKDASAAV